MKETLSYFRNTHNAKIRTICNDSVYDVVIRLVKDVNETADAIVRDLQSLYGQTPLVNIYRNEIRIISYESMTVIISAYDVISNTFGSFATPDELNLLLDNENSDIDDADWWKNA